MIKAIFAVGPNGEFGNGAGLPWDVPGDLEYFKTYTRGDILVMSGTTFETLPFLLPGRTHIVLSDSLVTAKNGDTPTLTLNADTSLQTLCELLDASSTDDVCVIGGRWLLRSAIDFADAVSVTEIDAEHVKEADIYFEAWGLAELNARLPCEVIGVDYGIIMEYSNESN